MYLVIDQYCEHYELLKLSIAMICNAVGQLNEQEMSENESLSPILNANIKQNSLASKQNTVRITIESCLIIIKSHYR